MPTLSGGIQVALRSVLTNSQAMEVIQNNVANANTPGYRRQVATLASAVPYPGYGVGMDHQPGAGQIGQGVLLDHIQRFSSDFLDSRYRAASGQAGSWDANRDILVRTESMLAETSTSGLIPKMDEFFSGWQQLASDPTNPALRTALLDNARSLAEGFTSRYQELKGLQVEQNQSIAGNVDEINSTATQVAQLNGEIAHVLSVGDQPNDLMDKRDTLIDRLAQLTGAVSYIQPNGMTIVSVAGHSLVTGTTAFGLTAKPDPASPDNLYQITWNIDNQVLKPTAGTLSGIFTARDKTIPDQIAGLNTLATTLMGQVNTIHSAGFGLDNVNGRNFFSGTNASDIQVDAAMNETTLATASAANQPGNNDIAAQMFGLKSSKVMATGTQTLAEFYNNQITAMGVEVRRAETNSTHHNLLLKAVNDQRESLSGVNLDEEAANLAKFQKAYQAAARVMNAYDELLDKVINGMGLVGR